MSPWIAVTIVTWLALLVLYLGLAATLRKVNLLSAELASLRARGDARAAGVDLRLPGLAATGAAGGGIRLVVAADTGCPACHATVAALDELAPRLRAAPILLTYEVPEAWQAAAARLEVRHDPQSWRLLAHLSPPVLMTVDATGQVADLALPTEPADITRALAAWGLLPTSVSERSPS